MDQHGNAADACDCDLFHLIVPCFPVIYQSGAEISKQIRFSSAVFPKCPNRLKRCAAPRPQRRRCDGTGTIRPSRSSTCSSHSNSIRPTPLPPPNRTDAASGVLRVFSGTHSARRRRRPEWKQRENSAVPPGPGRAPDGNRQDSGTPKHERYLPLRSAAIPEKRLLRTPEESDRQSGHFPTNRLSFNQHFHGFLLGDPFLTYQERYIFTIIQIRKLL